jgi:hypothetical protein
MTRSRHGLLEADHLVQHRKILRRHRLHGLDAIHEIVDARRAEQDGKRRLVVTRRIDRDEPLHERVLRALEVRARRAERNLVDLQVVLDDVQLLRRCEIQRARALEAAVELRDLRHHLLRLRALRAD